MRPDPWLATKDEWDTYLQTDEGKADQKQWVFMEQQRNSVFMVVGVIGMKWKEIEGKIESIIDECEDWIEEEIQFSERLAGEGKCKASGYSAYKTQLIHEIALMIHNNFKLEPDE